MKCEECEGIGQVMIDARGNITRVFRLAQLIIPCPHCGGCGRAHCCEGERPGNVLPERWLKSDER